MSSTFVYTEKELLSQAANGSQTAFTTLFNNYKDKLYSFIYRLTGSHDTTEDIIQEAFLKLWKDKESLRSIEHFSSYLFLMTRNQSINSLKRLAKESSILSDLNGTGEVLISPSPEIILANKEVLEIVHESLKHLPPQQRLVYTLSREHGLKHGEIALKLNISRSTVKNHMVQALKKLKENLRLHPDSIIRIYLIIAWMC